MKDYAIFGGSLRSELEFPALRRHYGAQPTWTLRIAAPVALPPDSITLGVDRVDASATVQLHRSSAGWHLAFDDTGRFDIDPAGHAILWRAPENAAPEAARLDVMGRVLATALHAAGDVCFHASAVALGDEAIGFLGAKGFGKSTLAWALVRAGARLITDDTLAVRFGSPALALPGVHELRLRSDTAHALVPPEHESRVSGDRVVVEDLDTIRLQDAPVRLACLYLLSPRARDAPVGARTFPVPAVASALSLVRHAKIGPLLSGQEAGPLLDRIAAVVGSVPVRLLEYPHDFTRLDDVVGDIVAWHTDGAGVPAA
jgi:hypothetical protein